MRSRLSIAALLVLVFAGCATPQKREPAAAAKPLGPMLAGCSVEAGGELFACSEMELRIVSRPRGDELRAGAEGLAKALGGKVDWVDGGSEGGVRLEQATVLVGSSPMAIVLVATEGSVDRAVSCTTTTPAGEALCRDAVRSALATPLIEEARTDVTEPGEPIRVLGRILFVPAGHCVQTTHGSKTVVDCKDATITVEAQPDGTQLAVGNDRAREPCLVHLRPAWCAVGAGEIATVVDTSEATWLATCRLNDRAASPVYNSTCRELFTLIGR